MLILDVDKVSKDFGFGTLFEDICFSLNEGEKISIVGSNGCGKSTLLKILAGLEKCDSGTVSIKKGVKVVYLDQTAPDKSDDRLVIDVLKDAFEDLLNIQKQMDADLEKLNDVQESAQYDKILAHYGRLQETFQNNGGYDIDVNIEIICNGLEIYPDLQQRNYNYISGGEKTLVYMAKALLQKPDLILLDEPTNHLDIKRIEWLEEYVKTFKGAAVIVSHDRTFLDHVSNHILEISNGNMFVYHTNYTGYLKEKEEMFEKLMSEYKSQQEYFDKLEKQAKRFADAGMATNSTAMTKKASVMYKRIEREKAKMAIKRPVETKKIKIGFDKLENRGKRMIELRDLTITAGQENIVEHVNMYVAVAERVAIVGHNGSGKSTIVKAILGEQELSVSGEVIISPNAKIGYLPQIIEFKDTKQTLIEYTKKETGLSEERVRSMLARFLFSKEDIFKRVGNLSGGERIRVRLAILLQQQINILIFDEPTNHIDIPTKESLEEAIENFEGTILAVSHDRFFINKFAQKIIEVDNRAAKTYVGNYDDYLEEKKRNLQ